MEILSIVVGLVSIVLAAFAIWQANEFKKSADTSEKSAQKALSDIGAEMRFLREYAVPELKKYGESMREFVFRAEVRSMLSGPPISTQSPAPTPLPTPTPETGKNLRRDVIDTVKALRHSEGKAAAMHVFESLRDRYDFGLILGELYALRDKNVVKWDGDQEQPQAYVDIELIGQ